MDLDDELKCHAVLQDLDFTMLPGETALDTILRYVELSKPLVRPWRYEQVEGMRTAYQAWLTLSNTPASAASLNTFQAGYTARDARRF